MFSRANRPRGARPLALAVCGALLAAALPLHAGPIGQDDVCDPKSGVVFSPAEGTNGALFFEDQWPDNGDLDFNDQVITYSYQFLLDAAQNVVAMKATYNLLAIGADFRNGLYLHLPLFVSNTATAVVDQDGNPVPLVDGEMEVVIPLIANTRDLFPEAELANERFINTVPGRPIYTGKPLSITVTFPDGAPLPYADVPFDLFIARTEDYSHQIHLPQFPGTDRMDTSLFGTSTDRSTSQRHFVNENGLPFALTVPDTIPWPQERVEIDLVYPDIDAFASSGGQENKDWYETNIDLDLAMTHGANNQPLPIPQAVAPDLVCTPDAPLIDYWTAISCTLNVPCFLDGPHNDGGDPLVYSITPSLPPGLSFDPLSGAISGTATVLSTPGLEYKVTASNTGGASSAEVLLAVNDAPPSGLAYLPDWAMRCDLGVSCISVTPTTSGGPVTAFTVQPELPAGLSMNPVTGIVSGAPLETHPAGYIYQVSAANSGGRVTCWISVEVD